MDSNFITKDELNDIVEAAVADGVKRALAEYEHKCIMQLKPEDVEQVRDVFNVIREIGHGSTANGVIEIRENHVMWARYRKFTGNVGTTIFTLLLLGAAGIAGSVFVVGFIEKLRMVVK